jgi:hypothetical protein
MCKARAEWQNAVESGWRDLAPRTDCYVINRLPLSSFQVIDLTLLLSLMPKRGAAFRIWSATKFGAKWP